MIAWNVIITVIFHFSHRQMFSYYFDFMKTTVQEFLIIFTNYFIHVMTVRTIVKRIML